MNDLVVITFHSRHSPLGFLSLKDKNLNVPGNAGMKDQQMVFKFVRDNIKNFGGDPQNVTLFGHSSGAACVGFHCLSESSRGLFQRAILTGGSPLGRLMPDLNWPVRLAEKLEFRGDVSNEEELLKFLEQVDVLKLVEASNQIMLIEEQQKYKLFYPFGPCIEPYVSESTFLTANPIDLFKDSWSNEIDIMFGGVAHEGRFPYRMRQHFFNGIFLNEEIPNDVKSHMDESKQEEMIEKWKEFYSRYSESEQEKLEKVTFRQGRNSWFKINPDFQKLTGFKFK